MKRSIFFRAEPEIQEAVRRSAGDKSASSFINEILAEELATKGYITTRERVASKKSRPRTGSKISGPQMMFCADPDVGEGISKAANEEARSVSDFVRLVVIRKLEKLGVLLPRRRAVGRIPRSRAPIRIKGRIKTPVQLRQRVQ